MSETKNSDFPMILVGQQVLEDEVNFTDVLKLCVDRKDYDRFKAEIRDNSRSMWGRKCEWPLPSSVDRKWSFAFGSAEDGSYEQWLRCKVGKSFWEKAGRIAAGKAAR